MEHPKTDDTQQTALQSMHDIWMPQPVSWFPQTWGWVVLAAALLVMLALAAIRWIVRYRASAYRREALGLLVGLEARIRDPVTRQQAVHTVAEIIKRTALAGWGRAQVASLSGADWSAFIEKNGDAEGGRLLERLTNDIEYQDSVPMNRLPGNLADELVCDARRWIEKHHV